MIRGSRLNLWKLFNHIKNSEELDLFFNTLCFSSEKFCELIEAKIFKLSLFKGKYYNQLLTYIHWFIGDKEFSTHEF